jgi:DNA-binding winged helix-turn-helix (wHTH) protein
MDFDADIDQFWIEDYLESLNDRGRRLVLLLDEFDVLADFDASFWEWFRGLITEYNMSIVVATRVELGSFREEWGSGSPFFNMFRSIYVGSFTKREVDEFISKTAAIAGIDLAPVAGAIEDMAGRFPFYLQIACALFCEVAATQKLTGGGEQLEGVRSEFRQRTLAHFEDSWARLPRTEQNALTWLAIGAAAPEGRDLLAFNHALPSLERRGYLVDGRLFSSAFEEFVRRQIARIEMNVETGEVRIERRPVDLPPKEFALLRFLLENEGEVVTKDEIAMAVWPEYHQDTLGVTDAMIQKTISRLRKEVDVPESAFQHIESVRGQGYRFQNASVYEVYQRAAEPNASPLTVS